MNWETRQAVNERAITQGRIRQLYPDLVAANQEKLCPRCRFRENCRLVPVTTTGEDCPHFAYKESGL